MSDIGVPNESALSYKNSYNAEQMCAKLRTLPADADIPGFPATCKRENVAV